MREEEREEMIERAINSAIEVIPAFIEQSQETKKILMIKDHKEFTYGAVFGMTIGITGTILNAKTGGMTQEDENKIGDGIAKFVPEIRERIFG